LQLWGAIRTAEHYRGPDYSWQRRAANSPLGIANRLIDVPMPLRPPQLWMWCGWSGEGTFRPTGEGCVDRTLLPLPFSAQKKAGLEETEEELEGRNDVEVGSGNGEGVGVKGQRSRCATGRRPSAIQESRRGCSLACWRKSDANPLRRS